MAFYSLIRRKALGLSVGKKIGFVDRSGRPLESDVRLATARMVHNSYCAYDWLRLATQEES
jgi:hypothetical protein